jgi:RecF/RecN/SMC N terminal domain
MNPCRISKLEIQGFRSFGQNVQTLDLPPALSAVWGPNSQGKTSLAEAVEFLLTGQIVRRTLIASSQDEFADALRNAHLPGGVPVFVQATLAAADGSSRSLKRTLKTDYGKKQDCETILEIDGKRAAEADLLALGIVLSQPPLRAPVLAQHTLGYLFSARPQDRATYFKTILEVTDLEQFRNAVSALESDPPVEPLIDKLELAIAVPVAGRSLASLLIAVPSVARLTSAFAGAMAALIVAHGDSAPDDYGTRIARLEAILTEQRAKTFPLKGFERVPFATWTAPSDQEYKKLSAYIAERKKVDEETRQVTGLFRETLALPQVAGLTGPIDCPLCGVDVTLTPERVAFIRQRISDTEAFQKAEKDARDVLGRMDGVLAVLRANATKALPLFISNPSQFRRERGFRVARIRSLLGVDAGPIINAWLQVLRPLVRRRAAMDRRIRSMAAQIADYSANPDSLDDPAVLTQEFQALTEIETAFRAALVSYARAEQLVSDALKAIVDAESKTSGWQELIELAGKLAVLRDAIINRDVHATVQKEIAQAVKQIDRANETVLDQKFVELSDGIEVWWNLLRPNELSFFSAVKPRPGARRTVDFKAGLAANPDRSDAKLRDVIAVFSQSQLHCLGLALFLARAVQEGTGFIVLDDPILSSDEDYRAYFNAMVLQNLCDLGIQVLVLTQDQRTWKDLGERYLHIKIGLFQIVLQNPAEGSTITNTADDLATALVRAETLLRGGHPSLHKQGGELIRDAAERFCKEMLVRDRRAKGDQTAAISDYDKNLGQMSPSVEALLVKDPSHQGKLRAIGAAVNPAKHDDAMPAAGVLKVALGDLRQLKKDYL